MDGIISLVNIEDFYFNLRFHFFRMKHNNLYIKLPLPYCTYITIVQRSLGLFCNQIKYFVDPIKRSLNSFIWNLKSSRRIKAYLSMSLNQTERSTMKR